jgi:hypothetical protein
MPRTLTQTCALCGLRYTNAALFELHIREDHVHADQQAAPDRGEAADSRTSRAPAGTSRRSTMAPGLPRPLQTPAAPASATRPRHRSRRSAMAALRRSARPVRQAVRAVRYVHQELLRASEVLISFRGVPEPRRPSHRPGSDTDPRPASESTQPTKRAA